MYVTDIAISTSPARRASATSSKNSESLYYLAARLFSGPLFDARMSPHIASIRRVQLHVSQIKFGQADVEEVVDHIRDGHKTCSPSGCVASGLRALDEQTEIRFVVHCSPAVSLLVGYRVNALHGKRTLSLLLQGAVDSGIIGNNLSVSLVDIEEWVDFKPAFMEVEGGGSTEEEDLEAFREEVKKLVELEQSGILRPGAWK